MLRLPTPLPPAERKQRQLKMLQLTSPGPVKMAFCSQKRRGWEAIVSTTPASTYRLAPQSTTMGFLMVKELAMR
jgi:hypothetical protein